MDEDIIVEVKDNQFKIYIDDLVHLLIKKDELIGVQSWILGDDTRIYCIEYTLKDKEILTEYNEIDKWKRILTLIDKNNLFNERF